MQTETQIKPGIGSNTLRGLSLDDAPLQGPSAGQGRRPVDPYSGSRMLPSILGIRLTGDLRAKLAAKAAKDGISDSALVRRLIADHLGDEAPVDRASGPRCVTSVPPEDLAAASRMLGTLTAFLLKAREAGQGDAPGVVAAMETAHERLVKIIGLLETRS